MCFVDVLGQGRKWKLICRMMYKSRIMWLIMWLILYMLVEHKTKSIDQISLQKLINLSKSQNKLVIISLIIDNLITSSI